VTLVTTLLDPQRYPARELAELCARRWQIELWFRHIKTSMGMEVLRCKTPAMVQKKLEMFLIGYNFIRSLMREAATTNDVPLERISFKGSVDAMHQFSLAIAQARSKKKQNQLRDQLLGVLARDLVPDRPGRSEPRAIKRRPKSYQRLNRPRHLRKVVAHRNHRHKNKNHLNNGLWKSRSYLSAIRPSAQAGMKRAFGPHAVQNVRGSGGVR
jgi:hypothetical protein